MGFRLSEDARNWFDKVSEVGVKESNKLSLMDCYYLCLTIGLLVGKDAESDTEDAHVGPEFVTDFTSHYKPSKFMILGLLVTAEVKYRRIDTANREKLAQVIAELLNIHQPHNLSEQGMRLLNIYAHVGYRELAQDISIKPESMDLLLRRYYQLLKKIEAQ